MAPDTVAVKKPRNGNCKMGLLPFYVAAIGNRSNRELASMRPTIALVITGLLLTTLAACNTVKGVGRDIESVGRAGERAM